MRTVTTIKNGYKVSPTIGELLVASAESLKLGQLAGSSVEKTRCILASAGMYVEVLRHLRRIRHPNPDGVIAERQTHIAAVMMTKRELDAEVDRLLLLYRDRQGNAYPSTAWPAASDDA